MADGVATPEGPPRRRESWSIKTIVEDISGRPITEFQDPSRPVHPYLKAKLGSNAARAGSSTTSRLHPVRIEALRELESVRETDLVEPDPVDRVYPPLAGATGRTLYGPEGEHHAPTLASVAARDEPPVPGRRAHAPGPSQRPERVYLHYLMLHLDRLHEPALRYLRHAVDEELRHREAEATETPR